MPDASRYDSHAHLDKKHLVVPPWMAQDFNGSAQPRILEGNPGPVNICVPDGVRNVDRNHNPAPREVSAPFSHIKDVVIGLLTPGR